MHKHSVLGLTLVLAGVSGVLYYLGNIFYLPWTYWWYDVLLHFLVSFTGALGIFWGLFDSGIIFRGRFGSRVGMVLLVYLCVMAIGIGWEVWEYVNNLLDNHEGYVFDTINDLILDSIGAFLAAIIATRRNTND